MTKRRTKQIGMVEIIVAAIVAMGFFYVEGTYAVAPTFTDCLGTIYVMQ